MKDKNKKLDHKDENRIKKVLSFLENENDEGLPTGHTYSDVTSGETAKCDESSEESSGVEVKMFCPDTTRDKKRKKDNWVRPALGNDLYRWNHYDSVRRSFNKKDGLFKTNSLFDNMDNELLLLFEGNKDYKLGEETLQFKDSRIQPGVVRRKYPNEYTIDPMVIKEELEMIRNSPEKRLKQFEQIRAKGKFRRLTEKERQILVRHIRTENVKKKFMNTMEWYFLTKLTEQRLRIREAEQIKYEKRVENFEAKICKIEEVPLHNFIIHLILWWTKLFWLIKEYMMTIEEDVRTTRERMRQLNEAVKKKVKEEREKAELMRRAMIGEELLITVDSTENEIKDKYEKFLLKWKLSELSEIYQQEIDAYCKYWKKKAWLLKIKMDEEKEASKQELELCEMQRILEVIREVEILWKAEAHRSIKEIMQTVKETVALIPPKENELKNLQEENKYLENKFGHWKKIIPEYIKQQEKFIQYSIDGIPEKKMLLECLNKLKDFDEPDPNITEYLTTETITLVDSESLKKPEDTREAKPTEKYDFAMDLAGHYLSDGDFEEIAQKLLQVKYIITDLLQRVLPSEVSLNINEENSEIKTISTSDDYCKICSPSDDDSSEKMLMMRKLQEIVEVIEDTFEIIGINFSTPNFLKPEEFIAKRIASINQIMNKQKADESKPEETECF